MPVGHSPSRWTRAVLSIRPRAQHGNSLPGDALHAFQHKRRIPAAQSLPAHGRAELAVRNEGHAAAAICMRKACELLQQIFGCLSDGPVVSGIVTLGNKTPGFRGLMRVVKKIVHGKQQSETSPRKRRVAWLRRLRDRSRMGEFGANGCGQLWGKSVSFYNAASVGDRSRVWKCRPGCQC